MEGICKCNRYRKVYLICVFCDLQVTSSNSANVEQHRLKCWPAISYTTTDSSKNGNLLNGTNLDNYGGGDRQMNHLSSTVRNN